MRRKINKMAMKTAAVGLSAMIAMSTPITALAAEAEGAENTSDKTPSANNEADGAAQEVKNKASELVAQEKTDEKGKVTQPAGAVKEAENKENTAVDVAKDVAAQEENAELAEKADKLEQAVTDENGSNAAAQNIQDAEKALEAAAKAEPGALNAANELKDAKDTAANADAALSDVNEKLEQSEAAADSKIEEINHAENLQAAQDAAAQAKQDITAAQEAADRDLAAIQTQLAEAKKNYEDAKKAVDEYNKAIEEASKETSEAAADLTLAKEQALLLQAAAEKEMADLGQQEKAALDIAKRQDYQENAEKFSWYQGDRQFMDIMNNYYIPSVLQKTAGEGNSFELDEDFIRAKNSRYADENYIKVFEKDENGNVVNTLYYNYHLDKDNKGKIVIFEKNPDKREKTVVVQRTNENYKKYQEDKKNNSTANADCYFRQDNDAKFNEFLSKPENAEFRQEIEQVRGEIGSGKWKADNQMFDLVMKNYYVPQILGWKNAKVSPIYQYTDERLHTEGYKGGNGYDGNAAIMEKLDESGKVIERRYFNYSYGKGEEFVIYEKTSVDGKAEIPVYLNKNYDNYLKGDSSGILFFEAEGKNQNSDYNNYIQPAVSYNNYDKVKKAAENAADAAQTAEKQVNSLKTQIDTLKINTVLPAAALQELEKQLKTAQENFAKAKEKADNLKDKLQESEEALKQTAEQLAKKAREEAEASQSTPAAQPQQPVQTTQAVAPAVVRLAAPAVEEASTELDVEEEELVQIEEIETPLAGEVQQESEEEDLTEIQEPEVPLASKQLKKEMSWWWLLVVAVLGTAGYALYRKSKAKKAAENN